MTKRIPSPFPYQGSKRLLAGAILEHIPINVSRFFEPFAGSAAMALAVASQQPNTEVFLNDVNEPLANLWKQIIESPDSLSLKYEKLWNEQQSDPKSFYKLVRNRFNDKQDPADFLYLLARCVKGAVRYNSDGLFNQSPDNRRLGTRPEKMRSQIKDASDLLKGRTFVSSHDYREALATADSNDLVYLDPPYQGVSSNRDSRYLSGLNFDEFVDSVRTLISRGVPLLISYDGKTGDKVYGKPLPDDLDLEHFYLNAGKSTSSTLHGRSEITYESLYISKSLINSGIKQDKLFQ